MIDFSLMQNAHLLMSEPADNLFDLTILIIAFFYDLHHSICENAIYCMAAKV